MIQTRSQKDMKLALERVENIEKRFPSPTDDTKSRYQALCKSFPTMLVTMGLCQTIAFAESKKGNSKGLDEAYGLILDDVSAILKPKHSLLSAIQDASATEYMHQTRRLLEAWEFYKRFADSVLTVEKKGGTNGSQTLKTT